MSKRARPVTLTIRLTDEERQMVKVAAEAAQCCTLADWLMPMAQWTLANPREAQEITHREVKKLE